MIKTRIKNIENMKKLITTIVIFTFVSCKNEIPKKPFMIINKNTNCLGCGNKDIMYIYVDANNEQFTFIDNKIYFVGDTIK